MDENNRYTDPCRYPLVEFFAPIFIGYFTMGAFLWWLANNIPIVPGRTWPILFLWPLYMMGVLP